MQEIQNLTLETQAYLFGKALVMNIDHIKESVNKGFGSNPAAPYNTFSHARTLSNASNHFVSVNNDTLYSNGMVDLSQGPVVFSIPEIKNRYYVFQLVDAWTNNFGYLGQRTLGEQGGHFIFATADQIDTIPADYNDYTLIKCPSEIFAIVGRIACLGADDLQHVINLQNQIVLKNINEVNELTGVPEVVLDNNDDLSFWKKLRTYVQKYPVSPSFKPIAKQLASVIGLDNIPASEHFFDNLDSDTTNKLIQAQEEGEAFLAETLQNGHSKTENGWQEHFHIFDYNVDYFELGALNSPKWVVAHDKTTDSLIQASLLRTLAATAGLWGNNGYEALYFPTYVDDQGNTLDGNHEYTITFETLPPVDAFWSITMYDAENFMLVDNAINRYSIGDRTEGLKYNEDDSLTIHISAEQPAEALNWLPAPKGPFRPILRAYLPQQAIFDAKYLLPGIKKIN